MTPTSAERGHETREQLLDAAAQLIVEDGWGGVTTRRVADRAGLRPGLVHYHFRTVDDLLIEAALNSARQEMRAAADALSHAGDLGEGVGQVLEMMSSYTSSDPSTVLFSEMLLASTRSERLRTELAELLSEWRTSVADWLRNANDRHTADGSEATDDFEATAMLLGAALDGLVLHRLIDPTLAELSVTGPLARLAGVRRPDDT